MATEPIVSVCLITYNHAPYIERAVTSVLEQKTDFPFELVIGEDCSTDGTREKVLELEKRNPSRVRVITSAHNVGMRANSKRTKEACRGTFIANLEGDDYWHDPHKLQLQASVLLKHSEVCLVFSNSRIYNTKRREWDPTANPGVPETRLARGRELFRKILLGERPKIFTATTMLRADVLRGIRERNPDVYDADRFMMLDQPTWLFMSWEGDFHYLPQALATYNLLEESATYSSSVAKTVRFVRSITEMREFFLTKYAEDGPVGDRVRRDIYRRLLYWTCKARDAATADWALERMRRVNCAVGPMDLLYARGARSAPLRAALCAYRQLRDRLRRLMRPRGEDGTPAVVRSPNCGHSIVAHPGHRRE